MKKIALADRLRQRRAWRRFIITYGAVLVFLGVVCVDYLAPHLAPARLSAQLAPRAPYLHTDWLKLPAMSRYAQTHQLTQGDSLAALFARNGIAALQADIALDALNNLFDSRILRPGQKIRLFWETDEGFASKRFAGFDFVPHGRERVIVRRLSEREFVGVKLDRALSEQYFLAEALITNNIYEAARNAGLSPKLVLELIYLFSYSIDFQRAVRAGDTLEVLFTRRFDSDNRVAEDGRIVYATLTNNGKRHAFWLHPSSDNAQLYYDAAGVPIQRLLMRTPIDGAKLSSHFGMRQHPILGNARQHSGLDFAAPIGTPVFAAGDGAIIKIGDAGSFGKRIRIRHNSEFETVYAHLHEFKKGLKLGQCVRQGEIIGHVGQRGLTNGAHLHYEIWQYGKAVDPAKIKLPAKAPLVGIAFEQLTQQRKAVAQHIAAISAARNNSTRQTETSLNYAVSIER